MQAIIEVIRLMKEEMAFYKQLFFLAEEKHDSLKQKDLQRLDEIIKKEQGVLFEIKLMQQSRDKAVRNAALEMQMPLEEMSLRALAEQAPEPLRAEILALREEFSSIMESLKLKSEINRRIIENELDYVGFMLSYTTQEGTAANNYDQAGNTGLDSAFRRGLFDQKA